MARFDSVDEFLNTPENSRFKWGENDCALFANNMLVQVYDFEDVGEKFRGKYKTPLGAARRVFKLGYKSVADIPQTHLKCIPTAKKGCIALHPTIDALGVCNGEYSYFLKEHHGLERVENKNCRKFWGIECQQ